MFISNVTLTCDYFRRQVKRSLLCLQHHTQFLEGLTDRSDAYLTNTWSISPIEGLFSFFHDSLYFFFICGKTKQSFQLPRSRRRRLLNCWWDFPVTRLSSGLKGIKWGKTVLKTLVWRIFSFLLFFLLLNFFGIRHRMIWKKMKWNEKRPENYYTCFSISWLMAFKVSFLFHFFLFLCLVPTIYTFLCTGSSIEIKDKTSEITNQILSFNFRCCF